MPETIDASRKVVIENVEPELDCGLYAVKREVGDTVTVRADIFKEGHDAIAAAVWYRPEDEKAWRESRMKFWDNDRWEGTFSVDRNCRWYFTVVAWTDAFGTWQQRPAQEVRRGPGGAAGTVRGRAAARRGRRAAGAGRGPRPAAGVPARDRGRRKARGRRPHPPQRVGDVQRGRGGRIAPHRGRAGGGGAGPGPAGADGAPSAPGRPHPLRARAARAGGPRGRPLRRVVRALSPLHERRRVAPRHLRRRHRQAAVRARHGLRRAVLSAHPPHRLQVPQGQEQHAQPRPRRARRAVRRRLGRGRAQGRAPGAGHAGGLSPARGRRARARAGDRAGLRHPGVAGPPVRKGAPGLVLHPPGRHHHVRGEPAQEVPGHLSPQLLRGRLGGAVGGVAGRHPALGGAGGEHLPRGQPAHQARAVLAVDDPRGAEGPSPRSSSSPRRSRGPR